MSEKKIAKLRSTYKTIWKTA